MEWIRIFENEERAIAHFKERKLQRLVIRGQRICLAIYKGRFFAVEDTCTHNGESLSKGLVNYAGEVVCPWHSYRFDLATGKACQSSCRDLSTYPVKMDAGGFFIGI